MKIEMQLNPHDRAVLERIAAALEGIGKALDTNLPIIAEELKPEPPPVVSLEVERGTPTVH